MNISGKLALSGIIIIALTCMSGCSKNTAPDAGFIEDTKLLKQEENVPFDGYWIKTGTDLRNYKKVYVAPIDVTHLLKMNWWEKLDYASSPDRIKAEVAKLAEDWRDRTIAAFKAMPDYKVVDVPDSGTLLIELAIVEVVPSKIWLNSISEVILGAVDTGSTAMEGRFRMGPNGEILSIFKDSEIGQYDIVSVADLEWYGHTEHTLDHWSGQLAQICSSAPGVKIPSAYGFTLRPW